jgi:DNA repair protein RadC
MFNEASEIMSNLFGSRYEEILNKIVKETKDVRTFFQNSDKKLGELGCTPALIDKINAFKILHKISARAHAIQRYKVTSPSSIARIFMEEMRYLKREHIKVIFLDTKNGIICDKDISVGTVNTSLVDPREVFTDALEVSAVNIILLHNHPSGDPEPSVDDIEVTKRVYEAGRVIGIELLDHIIIADGDYISLKEKGLVHLS